MNNVFVYCEIEGAQVQEVSQELLTKGRKLANELGVCTLSWPAQISKVKWKNRFFPMVWTNSSSSTVRVSSPIPLPHILTFS